MAISPPLSLATGYCVVILLGTLFAAGMIATTWALKRYQGEIQTSEQFSTAGRSVKTGLVAAAVVSSWTWAATLLQSSGVAYRYGVSGPFWYASGATVQILLFAVLAIELKRRAPAAHTFLEVIRARYGKVAHIVYFVFGIMTNILVSAMLLTGGSAVVNTLTGMPTAAACFLLPIGVVLYTMFGGIKATFLTDYIHTVVILVIITIFSLTVYASSATLGSPKQVFDLLVQAAAAHPVDGNAGGSYLTMRSYEGIIFFVINIVGNFGTVFCDAGYFQKAIAANPAGALKGYILGGLCWFAIPFCCATTMGLAALSLETNPAFPTYPNRMSSDDVSAGLVLPYAAIALLGKGGAAATLLLVFMAVTSAMSAELIAVSSLWTYDIYKTYWRPNATGKELIAASHGAVVGFALFMAGFSTGLYYIGISLGYLYLLMGVIISSAVLPITLTLMWKRMNWYAAVFSPILGFVASVSSWLGTAQHDYGELTVDSTGANNPMLVGNVVALLSPIVFIGVLTAIKPDNYDFETMKAIQLDDDDDQLPPTDQEAQHIATGVHAHRVNRDELFQEAQTLEKASFIAKCLAAFLTIALLVLWPMPMYGSSYIFSLDFFTGWVVVGIIWIFFSIFGVGLFPLWEGRHAMASTVRAIYKDLTGRGRTPVVTGEGFDTPPSPVHDTKLNNEKIAETE